MIGAFQDAGDQQIARGGVALSGPGLARPRLGRTNEVPTGRSTRRAHRRLRAARSGGGQRSGPWRRHNCPCTELPRCHAIQQRPLAERFRFAGSKGIYRQESGNAFDRHASDQRRRRMASGGHDHISGRKPTSRSLSRGRCDDAAGFVARWGRGLNDGTLATGAVSSADSRAHQSTAEVGRRHIRNRLAYRQ
jgi:hypothetical protein